MYVKKKKTPAPSTAYPSTFMADARSSASTREQRAAATAMSREVKKLSWFERNVLCMKVEIHHENYQAYMERKTIQDNQQLILHRLSGAQTAEPTLPQLLLMQLGTVIATIGVIWRSISLLLQMLL
jgi:hypothetical protein